LLASWLNEPLKVRWHDGKGWKETELRRVAFGLGEHEREMYAASAGPFALTVTLRNARPAAGGPRRVVRVEGEVAPAAEPAPLAAVLLRWTVAPPLRCVWKPLLAPRENMAVGDKVFRAPAIVFESETELAALVPDLDVLAEERAIPHVMDYALDGHMLMYGLCDYAETGHVYHELAPRARVLPGPVRFAFDLVEWDKEEGWPRRDFRPVERYLWHRYAAARMPAGDAAAELDALEPYVRHAYGWALERWKDVTWQQFSLVGAEVGGVVFIVRARQKPGLGREDDWREPKSLWNQAWFCGLRSAYGYAWWGRQLERPDWVAKARLALEFALAAPQTGGLFPAYYQAGPDNRWETGRWVMSAPRRPEGHENFVHLLDASWTCLWLLKWHRDIERDGRILPYVRRYADRLLRLQREDGSFPAWVSPDGLTVSPYLAKSPETSAHVMLLCLLNETEPDPRYLAAAERAGRFVLREIVPEGRWEDFETYWSCSREWEGKRYGEKDARSGLYNQCTFGMYWTAEAFKELYRATGRAEWLDAGERVLAEASLYQQIWQPPFFPVPTVGGFGVMNSDDEWNDARQSLFALTYWDYYRLTGDGRYRARALWAMKASFYMMYCPENPQAKAMYERVHPHLDERDYGFHMENFNHHDGTAVDGIGEFTIFDWGCGAAAASLAEFRQRLERG